MHESQNAAGYQVLAEQLDALQKQGKLEAAIDQWKQMQSDASPPDWVAGHLTAIAALLNKRGIQLFNVNRIGEALAYFTLAMRACAYDAAALNNAGTCLKELGWLDASTALYRRALKLRPDFAAAHSNILMNMHYQWGVAPAMLAVAQREWDDRHARPLRTPLPPRSASDPERELRIGLVSGDLGQHPVGVFLARYLENIDPPTPRASARLGADRAEALAKAGRKNFIFSSYSDGQHQGAMADRMHAAVSHWYDVKSLSDEELAAKIAEDEVDILIDLAGHTAENRLGVFARKPAPVQISWLGYPGDTGLSVMDYVIGDRLILPQALQPHCAALIMHLPDCFVCFDPPADAPPVNPTPATVPGEITFGCFNNPAKCGPEVVKLWAEILTRLPKARLLLKYKGFGEALCRQKFEKEFAAAGIDPARLTFEGTSSPPELFATMQKVDLALDPFPFAGGLMTCLTLWMGVPVLTWPGETFASRQGLSFLFTIGITDTIATNRQDYLEKAVALASDLPRLNALRQSLRPAMEASPLCDGPRAAAGLQDLLREIWREKCV